VTTVRIRPEESFDKLLKRFRNKVQREKILSTVRRKRFFVSKSELRRKQKMKAIRKARRRRRKKEDR
jgi:small subunit ribosomal protein S21